MVEQVGWDSGRASGGGIVVEQVGVAWWLDHQAKQSRTEVGDSSWQ